MQRHEVVDRRHAVLHHQQHDGGADQLPVASFLRLHFRLGGRRRHEVRVAHVTQPVHAGHGRAKYRDADLALIASPDVQETQHRTNDHVDGQ